MPPPSSSQPTNPSYSPFDCNEHWEEVGPQMLPPRLPTCQPDSVTALCAPTLRLVRVSVPLPPGPLPPLAQQHSAHPVGQAASGCEDRDEHVPGSAGTRGRDGLTQRVSSAPGESSKRRRDHVSVTEGVGRARRVRLQGPSRGQGQGRDNPTRAPRWQGARSRPPLQNPSSNPSSSHLPFRIPETWASGMSPRQLPLPPTRSCQVHPRAPLCSRSETLRQTLRH